MPWDRDVMQEIRKQVCENLTAKVFLFPQSPALTVGRCINNENYNKIFGPKEDISYLPRLPAMPPLHSSPLGNSNFATPAV